MKDSHICFLVIVIVTVVAHMMLPVLKPSFVKSDIDGQLVVTKDKVMLYSVFCGLVAGLICTVYMKQKQKSKVSFGFYY